MGLADDIVSRYRLFEASRTFKYVRYTRSSRTVVSDWGHAMFVDADEEDRVSVIYGRFRWEMIVYNNFPGLVTADRFIAAWRESQEVADMLDVGDYPPIEDWQDEDIVPEDITETAGIWDSDLVEVSSRVASDLAKSETVVILTYDGAILLPKWDYSGGEIRMRGLQVDCKRGAIVIDWRRLLSV